jgi:hypothetical protein
LKINNLSGSLRMRPFVQVSGMHQQFFQSEGKSLRADPIDFIEPLSAPNRTGIVALSYLVEIVTDEFVGLFRERLSISGLLKKIHWPRPGFFLGDATGMQITGDIQIVRDRHDFLIMEELLDIFESCDLSAFMFLFVIYRNEWREVTVSVLF